MRFRILVSVCLVLFLALVWGCGGGGSSSGGSSSGTIVGTWNLVSSVGGQSPQQVILNANGTGSYSGAPPDQNGATTGTFTWTQTGNQVTLTQGGITIATITNLPSPVGNTLIVISGGITATYNRA